MKYIVTIIYVFCVALTLTLAGCATGQYDRTITATLQKTEDALVVTPREEGSTVSITSESGIGRATLTRAGKSWSPSILIRLKLNNLESFRMSNGNIRFRTSMKSPAQIPYWKIGKKGKPPHSPDGTLKVPVRRTGEWFEIHVPSEMIQGNPKELYLGWVNEFR